MWGYQEVYGDGERTENHKVFVTSVMSERLEMVGWVISEITNDSL